MTEGKTTTDAAAIQRIESATLIPSDPMPLSPIPHPCGNGAVLVAREGYEVRELDGPQRGRRVHQFHDLRGFADWLNRHAVGDHAPGSAESTEILVDTTKVVASLDPGDPDGDVVECTLATHPSFDAWSGVFGKQLDQITFHRLVIAEAETLGEEAEGIATALLQVRIATQGDFDSQMDALGYMKVVGGTGRQEATVKLPPRFKVRTPILDGVSVVLNDQPVTLRNSAEQLCSYELEVFLQLKVVGEGAQKVATFELSCPRIEAHRRQARRDAAAYLQALLADGFLVGLGTVKLEKVAKIAEPA